MKSEVLTGPERRRRWSSEQKADIVAQTLAAGAKVGEIAQRYGISRGLLYTWRREAGRCSAASQLPNLVPVVMTGGDAAPSVAGRGQVATAGVIDISLPGGIRVRVRGGVEESALRTVLGALRSA